MYTQCPACLTTFKVTPAQLAARGGVVRCGICTAVFHAEQRLLQTSPAAGPDIVRPPQAEKASLRKSRRARGDTDNRTTVRYLEEEVDPADFPIVTELQVSAGPRSRWRAVFWSLGDLLLVLALAGQFVFFYRDELATIPSWRPTVAEFCRLARCELRPLQNVAAIELLQTTIAPHPQYSNALRIRTTLVNRADFAQDYPWMEISLTDSGGRVIARRTFTPAQYLPAPPAGAMSPNVVATTLLDITNPDAKAVGYEIRLVTPGKSDMQTVRK